MAWWGCPAARKGTKPTDTVQCHCTLKRTYVDTSRASTSNRSAVGSPAVLCTHRLKARKTTANHGAAMLL